jgi:putative addiction module component (TIGR02574 family)
MSAQAVLARAHCFCNSARPETEGSPFQSKHGTATRGGLISMMHVSVADILEFPIEERIHLVELIWERVAAFPQSIEVSAELKTELDARFADFEGDPEAGY